ncbi:MAG: hypothetical protein KC505_07935 [Myxococcales bacterium]|nr:hypothetical protein [Myxococcales bacterium]USN51841.1 MAG: hypothetical protein H6731_05390 [Myxococcales bacterium]
MTTKITSPKSRWFETTIGEFVETVYEVAMEEFMDERIARRVAMQMLIRKLRLQHKLVEQVQNNKTEHKQKRAYLRSELNKRRAQKK